ncbi:phage tail protein [Clostridium sp. C2-6-12]|uniref:phage tail protein n=1 Tax=Clostridium sp. C2-6-12 TaxID=2698832 RepID=UPI0013713558|nr:phage tail protein [Clostridium sp. C2-6-12]
MSINIKIDDRELKKTVAKLGGFPKEIPKATSAALNRTISFVTKTVKKEVTKEYSIKSGEVGATFKIRKASSSSLSASINSKGRVLTLSHFPANLKAAWTKGSSVKVKVKKSGYKQINSSPSAFVASVGGSLQIVRRKTSKRYPVEVLKTLSIPQMVSNIKINETVKKEAAEQLQKRVEHEVEYRLNKLSK